MERPGSRNDDTIQRLGRADKYQLGAGDGLLFAPSRPLWLRRTGFWDGVQYFMHVLQPAFTVSIVDEAGREFRLRQVGREWTPAELTADYATTHLAVREHRVILPRGRVAAGYRIENTGPGPTSFGFVSWIALDVRDLRDSHSIERRATGIAFRFSAKHAQSRADEMELDCLLHLGPDNRTIGNGRDTWCVAESERSRSAVNTPDWDATPLSELWSAGRLPDGRYLGDTPDARTLVHLAVSRTVRLDSGETQEVDVCFDISATDPAFRLSAPVSPARTAPARSASTLSREAWSAFFAAAPSLLCSDAYVDRYFAYRWYGLRLNFLDPVGGYRRPTCAEGTGVFHAAVSYSAWCHARELRWLPDPERARGTIRTFLDHQRTDGSLPGIIYANGTHPTASYFADWGASLLAVDEVHPDPGFLEESFGPLGRFAAYMDRTRDPEQSGLYCVHDPYETGQETMSRYTAVDDGADTHHFDYTLQLTGVDLTIYMYRLHRALAWVAAGLDRQRDRREHDTRADHIADAVRTRMWDPNTGMFSDLDPRSGERTGIRAAVCFLPWMTDIAGAAHVAGLERNLFDPTSFWTPFPVPSTAADDPTFDAHGFWKGVRRNCPWNGRVWPMANCHIAEALGTQATTHAPQLRQRAGEFVTRFIRMLFFDADPDRPNAFEHYSPITGKPSAWRGIDDYQHSWINDLIVRWIIGFRPTADGGFVIDPLPCGIEKASLERLPFRGTTVSIRIDDGLVTAAIGGRRHTTPVGQPLVVQP